MTEQQELKKINIDLIVAKKDFKPRFGNKNDLNIIKEGEKLRKLKQKNKLKTSEEISIKKYIIFLLKKRNDTN